MDAFDVAAATYDADFTHSAVGTAQRDQVLRALAPLLEGPPKRVLELNCGTGVDAVHMARAGHSVLATDRSRAMLAIVHARTLEAGLGHLVRTAELDLQAPQLPTDEGPFDLVLSNLGGLNCIDAEGLERIGRTVATVLRPGGIFVAVLIADRCLLETLYYLIRIRPTVAFRRWTTGSIEVPVGTSTVTTWYHSPMRVRNAFGPHFVREYLRPIGLFVPPGYLEPRLRNRPILLRQLARLDRSLSSASGLARLGDHYLIQFRRTA
jgi:SAM-dependent methyltransferase